MRLLKVDDETRIEDTYCVFCRPQQGGKTDTRSEQRQDTRETQLVTQFLQFFHNI